MTHAPGPAWSRCIGIFALGTLALLWDRTASARTGVRPLFEPTDLEMEKPGTLEADVQLGMIRGRGPWRVVIPDFEVDFGILSNLELDLDGAYAIEGPSRGPFAFDHAAPDSLWLSAKLGLLDWRDEEADITWATGVQAGPKLPVARKAHGVGIETLWLVGFTAGRTALVLNTGAFYDPSPDRRTPRPVGLEVGVDVEHGIGANGRFSLKGEVAAVYFLSPDPHQLASTFGPAWRPYPDLELSLVGLVGYLGGGDRYGLLLGVAPKLHLFE
jgi:hypothetical protein